MKIELFSRKRLLARPKWYFRIVAGNGEIVAQSEGYSRRLDAVSTANSLKEKLGEAKVLL
jgi:uncharacterized protein YegP (UPF0339 family)